MKKLFLVALAAIALVACNNNQEPVDPTPDPGQDSAKVITQNLIYDHFKEVYPVIGMDQATFETTLTNAGWSKYEGTEIFVKTTNYTTAELNYELVGENVYKVTYSVRPYKTDGVTYEQNLTIDYVKDFIINKVGYNFELGTAKTSCRFVASYSQIGGKVCSNTNDFNAYFTSMNLNGSTTYYVSTAIETWTPESQVAYVGAKISFRESQLEGTSEMEFNVAVELVDETMMPE